MTALEIVMLIIGILCFCISFLLTKDDEEPVAKRTVNVKPELSKEQVELIKKQVEDVVNNHVSMLEETTEASLDKISNTKILEMNEYVDAVMNEINKNHNETVFMYDMLNEKAKEVKNLVKEVNDVNNKMEATGGSLKVDAESLEILLKEAEKTVREMDIAIKAAYKTKAALDIQVSEQPEKQALDNIITPQFFELKETPQNESNENVGETSYMAKAEPESIVMSNSNEQILFLHSQGKSNLEIAKTLNLGMGEVKLVIDLFNKNK